MIYLYLFGTCFHFIYVFMIIGKKKEAHSLYTDYTPVHNIYCLNDNFLNYTFTIKYDRE